MTFSELNAALIPKAEALCAQLLPGGHRDGRHWTAGSTEGGKGRSLKVTLTGSKSGIWKDFASDEGGDLLKLIERCKGTDAKGAADFARDFLGLPPWEPDKDAPRPFDPLSMRFRGTAGTAYWTYRDANGAILCHAVRFQFEDGKKDVIPMKLVDGKWAWKGFAAPLKPPIYGLDRLTARPDAPVLIVEGEKTADAASKLFPGHVCITWLGGCKAVKKVDWTAVMERKVTLWPDADEPGRKAMGYLHQLIPGAVLVGTTDLPEGWDLADPPPDGFDAQGRLDGAEAHAKERAARVQQQEKEQDEKEKKDKYHLPRGCKLNDVLPLIQEYGLFEYQNRVYSVWYGAGVRGKYAEPVSNFTCKIEAHIELPDGEALKLLTIRSMHGEQFTYHVKGDAVLTLPTFRKVTAGDKGNFDWNATDLVYRHYLRYMQDRMGRGRIIRELGQQPEGFFAMCNAIIMPGGKVVPIDEQGCFDHEGHRYYVPAAKATGAMERGAFSNARRIRYVESGITWHQLTNKLREVHREHSYMAIVFSVATAFRDIIHQRLGGFPLLFLYGEPGSGKDQLIDACRRLFGKPQSPLPLNAKNTGPGMVNMFAEMVNLPQCFAEWRNNLPIDIQEMVFGIWQGDGRRRGTKTVEMSPYATDSVPILCTTYVTGNEYPNLEEKGMTRFVIDEMDKDSFNAEELKRYHELGDMSTQGYSHLLASIVGQRPRFQEEWYSVHFKAAQETIAKALGDHVVHGRMMQNITTLLSVYLFFQQSLQWAFTADELVKHMVDCTLRQQRKRKEGDAVSDFWTCFITAKRKGMVHEDQHYRIEGDIITFFWGEIHPVYEEVYRTLGRKRPPLNETTMLGKLKKHRCFAETVSSFRIGTRRNRGQAFRMSETGTELRGLLETETPPDRHLGEHQGEPVVVRWGNRGPYVKNGKRYANLPKGITHENITIQEALELLTNNAAMPVAVANGEHAVVDDLPF